ncbi:MAG: Ig-like domain repeat protein, partial [Jatrophihabitans sp.]
FKAVMTGAAGLAIAGGMLIAGAGAAHAAAGDPTFETPTGNPGTVGSVGFFNASGVQVYSGTVSDDPIAAYFQAQGGAANGGGIKAGDHVATAYTYTPQDNKPADQWTTPTQLTAGDESGTAASSASYPGALKNSTKFIAVGVAGGTSINDSLVAFPLASTNDPGILQFRILTNGDASHYYSTDIKITGSNWTQVFPAAPSAAATTTSLTVTPAGPQAAGSSVTLSATVASATAPTDGSVKFFDGATQIGATQAYTGSAVSVSTTALTVGSHALTAQYVPAGATYSGSTSAAKTYTVTGVVTPTTTALAVNSGTGVAFSPVQLTATVSPAAAPGTVTFSDGSTVLGTTAAGSGTFTFTTSALGTGSHTLTATFNPTDPSAFGGSTNSAAPITLTAPSSAPDPQAIDVVVTPGSLTITTPYDGSDAAHTFHLGNMVLSADGTKLSATGQFGDPATGNNGVTVTDTRAGDLPWTASASSGDFVKGSDLINGHNFGFTAVKADYLTGNALNATSKPVLTNDVPADTVIHAPADNTGTAGLKGGPHSFANAAHGVGTVKIDGLLSLFAPTSTVAGTYQATLTFTVS